MSNEYGFFASKDHDRRYSADDFSAFFGDFFTNGVLGSDTNSLKASAVGDMNISIAAGTAYINGHWYRKASAQVLSLGDSDTAYGRTDAVVVRCDLEKRMVYPFIIEGEPAETPKQTLPVRNEKCYDLVLAYIDVAANCVEVTEADITDKRGFDDVCGFVTSAIDHIDTSALFAQYEAQWELLKAACANDADAVIKAWSGLNTVKTVNGIAPIGGNAALTQSDIPSDGKAYQMPYYVQGGTLSGGQQINSGCSVTFERKYKTKPLVFAFVRMNYSSSLHSLSANVIDLTESGMTVKAWYVGDYRYTNNLPDTAEVSWIALGELEDTNGQADSDQ